jgi:hypothetical protein
MAMKTSELETVDEPVLRALKPRPVRWEAVDPRSIVISFDGPSDTLLIHLFGRGRPTVSVPIDRYLYALVDPETEHTLGIHIEGFLAQAVKEHPGEIALLDHAELRGITPIEVRELQREVLGSWRSLPGHMNAVYAQETPLDKKGAVLLLLHAEHPKWRTLGKSAA